MTCTPRAQSCPRICQSISSARFHTISCAIQLWSLAAETLMTGSQSSSTSRDGIPIRFPTWNCDVRRIDVSFRTTRSGVKLMRPSGHRLTSGSLPFWASSQEALLQATALWPRTWDGVRPCFVDLSELSECLPIIAIRCGHNLQVEGPLQLLAAFLQRFSPLQLSLLLLSFLKCWN